MTAERLLHHYEKIIDAPDAIPRLRRFILDLAVCGKLMGADEANWKQSRITDCLEPLPDGRLIHQGWSPRCKSHASPNERIWGVLKTTAIQDGQFLSEQNKELPSELKPKPQLEVRSGDILITCAGPRARCGIACLVTATRRNLMISGKMYRFRANAGVILPQYLLLFLRADEAQASVNTMKTGSSENGLNLTQDRFSNLKVRFGPLAEQHRIVAKVEELMALCGRLETARAEREATRDKLASASLARLNAPDPDTFRDDARFTLDALPALTARPDQIKQVRQTILNLAVRGRLVPQDPNDEPASELLKRVPSLSKPSRYKRRSPELIPGDCGLSINNPCTRLPNGWQWVPLVQIARLESGHTPSRNRPEWWGGDVSWIGLVDARLHNNGTIFKTIQTTNEKGLANSAARLLPKGTVCFSRTASVGYVVIMGRPMATSQDFVNWVPTEAISSSWLQCVMIAERPAIGRFSKGAVHQTIYYPAWLSMHIALPPLAEQHRIVAKVEELMALCDRLEANLAAAADARRRLLEALLVEALAPDEALEREAAE